MKPIRLAAATILLTFVSCTSVKYADRYSFLPGKDALANTEAFQRCLDRGRPDPVYCAPERPVRLLED